MLKKIAALLLCLTLMCGAFTSGSAMMVTSSVRSMESDNSKRIVSITAVDDTLYLLMMDGKVLSTPVAKEEQVELGTVRCTDGETKAENLKDEKLPAFDKLFTMEGKPYGLCTVTGEYYSLLDDQGLFAPVKKEGVKLDTKAWIVPDEQYPEVMPLSSFFYQAGYLYYTAISYAQGYKTLAGRISIETGAHQAFSLSALNKLTPYEGDSVLAFVYDSAGMYTGNITQEDLANAGSYGIFDPVADSVQTPIALSSENQMGGFGLNGFCYGNGSLFYTDGGKIVGIDVKTGKVRTASYTGGGIYDSMGNNGLVLYANGYYVSLNNYSMVKFKLDDPSMANGALRIFGEYGTDTHKTFLKNHPEIPVEVSGQMTNSLEKLTQSMVSENDSYDVLLLMLSYMPVDKLIAKGYATDLTAYPEIMERVNKMYPAYKDAVTVDGKLYGVPVDMNASTFGVNLEKWEELGLTEEELPKTYTEFLDFVANWVYDYGEEHPDIPLFDYSQADQYLFSLMLSQYMAHTQWKGESTRFDTELFRGLLESFHAIDFAEIKSSADTEENAYFVRNSLFYITVPVGNYVYRQENTKPLYLAMQEGEEPFIPVNMSLLIINPKTERMNDALAYVQNYIDNLPADGANMTLFPEHNDPVEDSSYAKDVETVEKELTDAKARLEKADVENKASIQSEITSIEENRKNIEKYRFMLTAENITEFREVIVPMLYVQPQNLVQKAEGGAAEEINKLLLQYLGGTVDADKVVQDLDNRLKLMELEEQ